HDWREPLPHSSNREENGMWKELEEAGADTPEREPIFRKDLEVLDGSLSFLDEKAAAEEDKPWAACAGFVLPHPPWKAREDILETYKGKGDLPFNHKGEKRDICDRYLQEFYGNLRHLSEEQIKKAREVYFALITEFDEYCGRILDKLESTGLAENTIVFYFSDHGELAGEHGNWSKVSLLEPSIRVPLIVSWKGHFESGRRCSVPVSLLDLHPTFTDIAGVELPENLVIRGKSLLPYIEGKADSPAGNDILVEMEGEGWNHCRACLRRGRYKLVYNHTDGYHFYDLEKDPHEMNDLSDNAEVADIAADMKKSLSGLWDDPEHLDRKVLNSQARRRIAKNRNPCKDLGY
ncbi:MAG: sulfatase, partial [Fibrobacterota bacterium]